MEKGIESSIFFPGIFNYCDRWCEKCPATNKCGLYVKDKKKKEKHLAKGEDPYDLKIIAQDIKEDFEEAIKLILKSAEEEGLDLTSIPDQELEQPKPMIHPMLFRVENYMHLAHIFLKGLYKIIEEGSCVLENETNQRLEELIACYEILSWYHTLLPPKISRALRSKMEAESEKDENIKQFHKDDANGIAKVAYIGLTKSLSALQKIYVYDENFKDGTLQLMVEVDRLIKGVDFEFPEHHDFKRPGFEIN